MTFEKRWVLAAAVLCGCKTAGEAPSQAKADLAAAGTPDDAARLSDGGTWYPLVTFRDTSAKFVDQATADGTPQAGGWWVTPIHAMLLPDSGEVLLSGWGRKDRNTCHAHGSAMAAGMVETHMGTRRNGTTWVLNPAGLGNAPVLALDAPLDEGSWGPGHVLYCSGHAPLPDGRILYSGGAQYQALGDVNHEAEFGVDYARLFDPRTRTITHVPQRFAGGPAYPPQTPPPPPDRPWPGAPPALVQRDPHHLHTAWYPTNTRLPDGRVLIAAGFAKCCDKGDNRLDFYANNSIQVFDPVALELGRQPLSTLVPHEQSRGEIAPGQKDYTHTLLLQRPVRVGGHAFQLAMIGWQGKIMLFDYVGRVFAEAPNGQRPGAAAWNSTAALLPDGEIMLFGGTGDAQAAQRADIYDPDAATWRSIDTGIARQNPAAVLLPDGKVLLVNGWADGQSGLSGNRKAPVLLDPDPAAPAGEQAVALAAWPEADAERGYHSFALLLKDARLLIGGGTHGPLADDTADIGCEQPTARLYSPPYAAGPRPQLAGGDAPVHLKTGGEPVVLTLQAGTVRSAKGVALLAPGATTHSFDQNQRYVGLKYALSGQQLTVFPPESTQLAPVGRYLLFVVSAAGTPSLGTVVVVD